MNENSIKRDLVDVLLNKLKEFEITFKEASETSKFILENFPTEVTQESLLDFLKLLGSTYTMFKPLYNKYLQMSESQNIENEIAAIHTLIKSNRPEEANNLLLKHLANKF